MRTTILIVEEDARLAGEIVELLEADGHRTAKVSTVEDAMRFIGTFTPSLVVVDLGLDGAKTTRLLAELATADDGPPVLLVADAPDSEPIAAQLDVPLVRKPFTLDRLLGAVREALQRPRRPSRA